MYHPGPFANGKWSCCDHKSKHSQGCQPAFHVLQQQAPVAILPRGAGRSPLPTVPHASSEHGEYVGVSKACLACGRVQSLSGMWVCPKLSDLKGLWLSPLHWECPAPLHWECPAPHSLPYMYITPSLVTPSHCNPTTLSHHIVTPSFHHTSHLTSSHLHITHHTPHIFTSHTL